MLIGELSQKSGLTRDTIRFYEKRGLIKVGRSQRHGNNYKDYSQDHLKRLLLIKRLKNFGFTLNEVTDLLDLIEQDMASCDVMTDKMKGKVKLIEQKIRDLENLKMSLVKGINNKYDSCTPERDYQNCPTITDMGHKI